MIDRFRNMSIQNKLLFSAGVSLLAIVVVWILIAKIIDVSDNTFSQAKNTLEEADAIRLTTTSIQRISQPVRRLLHDWNVLIAKETLAQNLQVYEEKLQSLKEVLKNEKNTRVIDNVRIIETMTVEISELSQEVFLLADKKVTLEGEGRMFGVQATMEMANELLAEIDAIEFEVVDAMNDIELLLRERTTVLFGESLKRNKRFSFFSVVALLVSVILSTAVSFFIARSVSKPIKSLLRAFQSVSRGDLTTNKEIQAYGEMGVMVKGFYNMVEGLRKADAEKSRFEATLKKHNQEIRLILNNIGQGFLTVNPDGVMSETRSFVVGSWFGESVEDSTFDDYVRPIDASVAHWFELGMECIQEGNMPEDVCIGQLPKRIVVGSRTLELRYNPIHSETGKLEKLLIIISDITSDIKRELAEREQKEFMEIFGHIMRDKFGFLEFLAELDGMMETVIENRYEDLPHLKRLIHTIKGNTGLFGMSGVADFCQRLEDEIGVKETRPEQKRLVALQDEWNKVRKKLDDLLGDRIKGNIEINDTDYKALLHAISNKEDADKITKMVKSWKFETTQHRLDFIKQQAENLAQRMGKKGIAIRIQTHNIRLESKHWAPFWSSFIHILRNAIDHGIESVDDRSRVGKGDQGLIRIATFVEDGEFVISLEDDGRGIDWNIIRQKAEEAGLPHKNEADLVKALFQEGLSTKKIVTNFSGRGVGLGAAKEACEKRGGRICVESQVGKGTKVMFRFPMTKYVYYLGNDPLSKAA